MCRSIKDSLISGSIGVIVGIFLLAQKTPKYTWLAYFVLIACSMQFIDDLIWADIHQDLLSTYAIPFTLILQPLVIYMGYLLLNKRIIMYEIFYGIWACALLYKWITECKKTTVDTNGYLIWCGSKISFIPQIFYMFALLFPLLYFPDMVLKGIVIGSVVVTWIYNQSRDSVGSGWCYSQNFANLLILAYALLDGQ